MAYNSQSDGIVRQLQASLRFIADDHTRQATATFVRAWDDIAPELLATLDEIAADGVKPTRLQLVRSRRLVNTLALIEDRLAGAVDKSAKAAIDQLHLIVNQAGHTTDRLITSMLPPGESVAAWTRVDGRQVDAIVSRTADRITKLSYPLSDEATAAMKRELVRGMLIGSNPRETARRMVGRTEGVFNGGLSRALTIARTEQLDAQRAAAKMAEDANADVLEDWVWTANLGSRTCPSCWAQHGTHYPLEVSGPDDHQNGRCTRVPGTKSWKDLGFDIEEPPSILPNSEERFAALPVEDQRTVLGPGRFEAWKRGDFPMDQWSVRRENPGWRDSYVPARVPTV